jgi:putative ABC transport system substrate-binding protein
MPLLAATHVLGQGRPARIAFLGAGSAAGYRIHTDALRAGLKELGYVEGKTVLLEYRWAEGKLDRLPALAAELVRNRVDVIVTHGTPATRAAKDATRDIPIVVAAVGDALVTGLVGSLARPGGNVTGSTFFSTQLVAKRIELLKTAMPQAARIGVTFNPDNPIQVKPLGEGLDSASASLKVAIERTPVRSLAELETALDAFAAARVEAVVFHEEPMHLVHAARLVERATRHRVATIGPLEFAPVGALMAYGVHLPDLYRRAAFFVDKILKGAKPGDIPVEQASRFHFVINLATARAIGVPIPPHLIPRADRVIE